MAMNVKFWGVRGSIACPSPNHLKYGGNTTCIEVDTDQGTIIWDAGTGFRHLGNELNRRKLKKAFLLMTHTHWDHINGFPFFKLAYDPAFSLHIMAGHLHEKGGIEGVLASQMSTPMFPVPLEAMTANITYEDFLTKEFTLYGDVGVRTASLNHPNGATGYRIDHGGKSVCLITDTEHIPGKPDQNILELVEGADLVIYDSTYTDEEFPDKVSWGHSTWTEGARLCQAAKVKKFVIFHHDPDHDDDFMDKLAVEAGETLPGTIVAREGMDITLD